MEAAADLPPITRVVIHPKRGEGASTVEPVDTLANVRASITCGTDEGEDW